MWVESILLCRNYYYAPVPAFVLKGVSQSSYKGTTTLQNRTEQLRKLGKLQCCYLDQFNQKESSYATSRGCEAALQSEPRRGGSLHPGLCLPGKCSGHWVTLSICVFCMHNINNMSASMLDLRCNVAMIPLFLCKDGLPLEQL